VMKTSFALEGNYNLSAVLDAQLVLPLPVQNLLQEAPTAVPCLRGNSTTGTACVVGMFNTKNVTYPDPYDPAYTVWFQDSYQAITEFPKGNLYLHDLAPVDESSDRSCSGPAYVPKGVDVSSIPCLNTWIPSQSTEMYNLHADYGRSILTLADSIGQVKNIRTDVAMVGLPKSATFTGSKVEASWQGMQSSLREVLLMGMLGLPFTSMPACGTHAADSTVSELLCLRWVQLACYMPGMHSWYSGKDTSRLLYKIPKSYQRYVGWALEGRYKLIPYLRTLDREWYSSYLPLARPMFLEYPEPNYIDLWTQFMFGPDILVAPVLSDQSDLVQVWFPPGTWYTMGGGNRVNLPIQGANVSVHSKTYQIPVFIRGGATIVQYESAGSSVQNTEAESSLSVTVSLECAADPRSAKLAICHSSGRSYLNTENSQLNVTTIAVQGSGEIKLQLEGGVDAGLNMINSFFVIGLEKLGVTLTITLPDGRTIEAEDSMSDTDLSAEAAIYNNDQQTLLLRNLALDAASYEATTISWKFTG